LVIAAQRAQRRVRIEESFRFFATRWSFRVNRSSLVSRLVGSLSSLIRNPRLLVLVASLVLAGYVMQHPESVLPAMAQDDPAAEPLDEGLLDDEMLASPGDVASPGTAAAPPAPIRQRGWIDTFRAGGTIGVIIILLSFAATGLVVEHFLTIRKARIMPEPVLADLEQIIAQQRVQEGIDYCYDPRNASLATDVVLAGLERFQTSEFGFAEYKAACEEAGEEGSARLYRKIDLLNLIGAIAPMLGLLGTVQGMIEAFNVIASSGGAAQPHELADSISKALVTTMMGLIVAIPAMVAYSYFRNQIDSLVAETGTRVERIMAPLARRRASNTTFRST
jgi:biopolymer transport protein ExbB